MSRWNAWLALQPEIAIEPELPIVDAHHHLWDRGGHRYLVPEFAAEAGGHRVEASVYVECLSNYDESATPALRPVGETAFVASLPEWGARIAAGIVAAADLSLGEGVSHVLDAHERAGGAAFKGVRYVTAFDSSPDVRGMYPTRLGMLRERAVQRGAAMLADRGHTLDVWLYFHQLDDVVELAIACPGLVIVVDHCGGPIGIGPYAANRAEVFLQWREAIAAVSRCPNVVMKFGGLAMTLAGFGWRSQSTPPDSRALEAAWRPYFQECIERFGPQRCMFESNFPVDRTGCTYVGLWNAFKKLSSGLDAESRAALFGGTARRVYRLA